jgi:hypothetical protein
MRVSEFKTEFSNQVWEFVKPNFRVPQGTQIIQIHRTGRQANWSKDQYLSLNLDRND